VIRDVGTTPTTADYIKNTWAAMLLLLQGACASSGASRLRVGL